jgi:hypothetical protein
MKNIHVLSTNKETRLFTSNSELTLAGYPVTTFKTGKHIYIINSEEIKEETYFLEPINNSVLKLKDNSDKLIKSIFPTCKKIILTTDQDLIKDGVQSIPDDFLEWFVKNPSCEEVEVEDVYKTFLNGDKRSVSNFRNRYKIIIPKETFKQKTKDRIMSETSEETKQKAKDYGNSLVTETAVEFISKGLFDILQEAENNNILEVGTQNFMRYIEMFEKEAKKIEEEQKGYSEEEVLWMLLNMPYKFEHNIIEWFEQFKKK